jgi:hypothetical protein
MSILPDEPQETIFAVVLSFLLVHARTDRSLPSSGQLHAGKYGPRLHMARQILQCRHSQNPH